MEMIKILKKAEGGGVSVFIAYRESKDIDGYDISENDRYPVAVRGYNPKDIVSDSKVKIMLIKMVKQ